MDITWVLIIFGIALAVLFCLCLAIANFALDRFFDIYKECNEIDAGCEISTSDLVEMVNDEQFDSSLRILKTDKLAGDAYIHGGALLLSDKTLSSHGIGAFATIAHELGHALQDVNTNKLKVERVLNRIGKIISPFMFPSLIAGFIMLLIGGDVFYWGIGVSVFGAFIFLLAIVFKLLIINIEKDASKKAITILQEYLGKKELKVAKKLLNSAKLTYWADFFRTLLGWTFMTKRTKLFK